LFKGAQDGVIRSTDGGDTWTRLPNSGSLIQGLVGDGTRLYTSWGFPWGPSGVAPYQPYATALQSDPSTWAPMSSPPMKNGGMMVYDPVRSILYSTNLNAGVWRMVLR
jgi:hypothetical protein